MIVLIITINIFPGDLTDGWTKNKITVDDMAFPNIGRTSFKQLNFSSSLVPFNGVFQDEAEDMCCT